MPTNVVDFSAVSEIIRDEPWQLHFWELTPDEYFEQMKNPRKFIARLGVELPEKRSSPRCSTTIFSPRIPRFAPPIPRRSRCAIWAAAIPASPPIASRSYAHLASDVGRHKKKLLHKPEEKKVPGT